MFESIEYIIGVGLDACQSYLATASNDLKVKKVVALKCGPVHPSGLTIVEIINHAANFGKHDDEWSLLTPTPYEALDKLFVGDDEYFLTTILRRLVLTRSNRLQALLPHLRRWRDDLARTT